MPSRRPASSFTAALLAVAIVPVFGCTKLLQSLKDDAKDGGAETPSATESASAAAAAPDTTPSATTAPADEAFSAPGACIDVGRDITTRSNGSGAAQAVDKLDLDGDGKPDKVVRLDLGSDQPSPTFVYVMRGTCGHFVGQLSATSVKLSGNKSKGLKSLEAFEKNPDCADPCKCNDKSTAFFFNGKAYQAAKPKDVPRKCTDAGAAPSASASAAPAGKACKKGTDCGDDEKCIPASGGAPGSFCKRIDCGRITPGEVMVEENGDHDCVKPCKTDADCTQSFRPRQCQAGVTQLKPRKPISSCFPR